MIWLAAAAVVALLIAVSVGATFLKSHGVARVALRFATGMPLDGRRRTDAGFLRHGVRAFDPTGRASGWAHRPHAHRAAIRWGAVATVVALSWGWFSYRLPTLVVIGALALTGVALAARQTWRAIRIMRHRRTTQGPLALALSPILGVAPQVAGAGLWVDPGFVNSKGGAIVATLRLPEHFHGDPDQQTRARNLIGSRLGIDCKYTWRMNRKPMVLEVVRAPVPPDLVTLAEVMDEIDACKEGQVVLGKDSAGKIVHGDFLNEDPHWGVSAGSRRGKSTLLCLTMVQILRQHTIVKVDPEDQIQALRMGKGVGIDPKMSSLDTIVGLPRVKVYNDPRNIQAMWDGIHDFRMFMEDRMDAYSQDKTLTFERALLIIDEINAFSGMSKAHWLSIKAKEDPAQPPVWLDLAMIGWMGAQFKCNMIVVGQRLDSNATGGQGLRDSFGIRMLAGFTPQQWGFLVGTSPIPRSQKPRGRFIIVNGGEQTWTQLVWGEPEDVRAIAAPPVQNSPAGTSTGSDVDQGRGTDPTPLPVLYSLRDASSDLGKSILPIKYEALKKRRQTDDLFPSGRITKTGEKYTEDELTTWHAESEQRKASA